MGKGILKVRIEFERVIVHLNTSCVAYYLKEETAE